MRKLRALCGLALAFLVGCGGSNVAVEQRDGQPGEVATGSVAITIRWPEREEGVRAELLPEASNSVNPRYAQMDRK